MIVANGLPIGGSKLDKLYIGGQKGSLEFYVSWLQFDPMPLVLKGNKKGFLQPSNNNNAQLYAISRKNKWVHKIFKGSSLE